MTNHNPYHPTTSPPPARANGSFHERSRRIKMAAEMGLARSSRGRHWSQALGRRLLRKRGRSTGAVCGRNAKNDEPAPVPRSKVAAAGELSATGGEGEEADVERRVRALQSLVPGGEELGADRLFEETADYIAALQGQVNAMRALVGLIGGLEEKRMMSW